eukprot:1064164-Rhodomonas_salina.2
MCTHYITTEREVTKQLCHRSMASSVSDRSGTMMDLSSAQSSVTWDVTSSACQKRAAPPRYLTKVCRPNLCSRETNSPGLFVVDLDKHPPCQERHSTPCQPRSRKCGRG